MHQSVARLYHCRIRILHCAGAVFKHGGSLPVDAVARHGHGQYAPALAPAYGVVARRVVVDKQMAAVLQRNGVYGRVVVRQRGVGYRAPCQSAVVRPCLRYPRVRSPAVGACQQLQALLRVYEEGGLNELIFCSGRIAQRRRLGPCAAVVGAALHVYGLPGLCVGRNCQHCIDRPAV